MLASRWRPAVGLVVVLLQRCARHQQQVAGHELDAEHVTSVAGVEPHQLAGGAVAETVAVGVAEVPHPHGVIHGSRGHQAAVGAEGQAADGVRVAPQVLEECPRRQVPQLEALVLAGRRQVLAVGGEGQGEHRAAVPREETHRAALLGAPQAHRLVRGARGHVVRVGVEFHAVDVGQVAGIQPQGVGAAEGPEASRAILRAAGEVQAAGADVHVPHRVGVALEQHSVGEVAQIPVADGGVLRAGEQARAVRQEGGAVDGARMAPQDLHLAADAVLILRLGDGAAGSYEKHGGSPAQTRQVKRSNSNISLKNIYLNISIN